MRTTDGGGGYGGRIVVDPEELRTAAARFTDAAGEVKTIASRVAGHAMPEMPPEITGRVTVEVSEVGCDLGGSWTPYVAGAKELKVRALWAEISARGGTVEGLSAAQLRDFVAFMKDGSMLRYATQSQRSTAGSLVAELYKEHYKEPEKLIELAAIMKANGADADFSGAFIENFGAERFADIPRVIQAMEWGDSLLTMDGGVLSDQRIDRELARDFMLDGYRYDGDAVDLLSSFSMALATATYGGTLSRDTQRRLAHDEDTWAVAQLLHEGKFGAEFLRDVFHSGVIAQIGREGGNRNWGHQELSYWPIGGQGDHQLSVDQKQIIFDALERNPEALALALSDRVPPEFQFGVLDGNDDPISILYDHMPPDDDWERQFARMYDTATDYANDPAHPDPRRANTMTLSLIDRTLNAERGALDPMTTALAHDLADHQMDSLHRSAAAADLADADGGKPGWLDDEDGYRLNMNVQQMTDLFHEIGDVDDANTALLDGAARHQAALIQDAVASGDHSAFARQIGGFDASVMAANDLANQDDFDASKERHRLVFSFLHNASSLIEKPGIGIPVGIGLDELDHLTEPDVRELIEQNGSGESAMMNQMHAAIVQGFDQNSLVDVPERFDDGHGHLRPYTDLDANDRAAFNRWLNNDVEMDRVVREAMQNADLTRNNVFEIVLR